MNKLFAVRKFDILIANGNNKLLFNPLIQFHENAFTFFTRRPFCLREI